MPNITDKELFIKVLAQVVAEQLRKVLQIPNPLEILKRILCHQ